MYRSRMYTIIITCIIYTMCACHTVPSFAGCPGAQCPWVTLRVLCTIVPASMHNYMVYIYAIAGFHTGSCSGEGGTLRVVNSGRVKHASLGGVWGSSPRIFFEKVSALRLILVGFGINHSCDI